MDRSADFQGASWPLASDQHVSPAARPAARVVGFAGGTRIKTQRGEAPVESLRPGDHVLTRDNGYQAVRWAGRGGAAGAEIVRLQKGALGRGKPERGLRLGPDQGLLLGGALMRRITGHAEALVRARHLYRLDGIGPVTGTALPLVQVLFDRHELILAEGAWCGSFLPDDAALAGLPSTVRDTCLRQVPHLVAAGLTAARPSLRNPDLQAILNGPDGDG